MKLRTLFITSLVLLPSLGVFAQQTSVSATGFITDTVCGQKGANALHVDCAKRNVASGKAKYALYDERTKNLYALDPRETAVQYLGQRIKVTGTLSFNAQLNTEVLTISSVEPAPLPARGPSR